MSDEDRDDEGLEADEAIVDDLGDGARGSKPWTDPDPHP